MPRSLIPCMRMCGGRGGFTSRSPPRIRSTTAGSGEAKLIDALKRTTPAWFVELRKLAYTLDRRRRDILAHLDHPRTSSGPTEAINGRHKHLRGSALGFRNPTHYIAKSLLDTGGFKARPTPSSAMDRLSSRLAHRSATRPRR